jgi:ribosomal protein S18 acetylase RimI-like enzyme
VEYLVRTARITDIERLVALAGDAIRSPEGGTSPLRAADLFRQLVYLPQASIVVAEARRDVVGGAVLVLRPSVSAGGYVGSVDLLVVDPDHDEARVTAALLEELLRSAQNKGCTVVEAVRPDNPDALARLAELGFVDAVPLVSRSVAARTSGTRS